MDCKVCPFAIDSEYSCIKQVKKDLETHIELYINEDYVVNTDIYVKYIELQLYLKELLKLNYTVANWRGEELLQEAGFYLDNILSLKFLVNVEEISVELGIEIREYYTDVWSVYYRDTPVAVKKGKEQGLEILSKDMFKEMMLKIVECNILHYLEGKQELSENSEISIIDDLDDGKRIEIKNNKIVEVDL